MDLGNASLPSLFSLTGLCPRQAVYFWSHAIGKKKSVGESKGRRYRETEKRVRISQYIQSIYIHIILCVWVCTMCVPGASRGQKVSDGPDLDL